MVEECRLLPFFSLSTLPSICAQLIGSSNPLNQVICCWQIKHALTIYELSWMPPSFPVPSHLLHSVSTSPNRWTEGASKVARTSSRASHRILPLLGMSSTLACRKCHCSSPDRIHETRNSIAQLYLVPLSCVVVWIQEYQKQQQRTSYRYEGAVHVSSLLTSWLANRMAI